MELSPEDTKAVVTRLKRANGHLAAVVRMLEDGADCADALTQLAAVDKAISRAGFALLTTGLQHCLAEGGPESVDARRLEKVFLALA